MTTDVSYFISRHLEEIKRKQQQIQDELAKLPPGKLLITRDRQWEKWYCSCVGERIYIPKEKKSFARKLAKKRYLEALLSDCALEISTCKAYLQRHKKEPQAKQFLSKENPYHSFIFSAESEAKVQDWLQNEYQKNPEYPEHLIHKSSTGNVLRSKSEVLIDEMLFYHHIPYHYEEAFTFPDGTVYYPDFKIYSPKLDKFILWEHFGKMDDASYRRKAQRKLAKYTDNGIIPQRDLIVTTETKDMPLDYQLVNLYIHHYLV